MADTRERPALERDRGGGHRSRMNAFPETRPSVIGALAGDDAPARDRALDLVLRAYRGPVVEHLRHQWRLESADAEDLAHDFFAQALERDWLARFDPAKGRFRTFLRACLRAFASTAHDADRAQKRGGHLAFVPLDLADDLAGGMAGDLADDAADLTFDHEWARSILALALDALRLECDTAGRAMTFAVFAAHDVDGADATDPPTYASLAERFGLPVTQVANYLHWARRRFRAHVLDTLRALTASDAEYRDEVRTLIGREPS